MGLFASLLKLVGIGQSSASSDRGVYYYVRCDRCGEKLRLRVDPYWDLGTTDGGGFSVTKHLIGQKCFRTIEVTLTFDDKRQESERDITGGKFITAEEYAKESASGRDQRPAL